MFITSMFSFKEWGCFKWGMWTLCEHYVNAMWTLREHYVNTTGTPCDVQLMDDDSEWTFATKTLLRGWMIEIFRHFNFLLGLCC